MDNYAVGTRVDKILLQLNWIGRFQVIQIALYEMSVLSLTSQMLSVIFLGKYVEHQCASPPHENNTWTEDYTGYNVTYGKCTVDFVNGSQVIKSMPCPYGYHYPSGRHQSFTAEWDLVCERDVLSDLSHTLLSLGQLIGAFFFSRQSDRYGRKKVHIITGIGIFVVSIISAFSPNYSFFIATRFITGAFLQGFSLTTVTAFVELLPTKRRSLATKLDTFLFSTAMCVVALFAYLTRNISWRYATVIMSFFAGHSFVLLCILSESLRWLIATGRTGIAEQFVRKAARLNHTDADKALALLHSAGEDTETAESIDEHCNSEFLFSATSGIEHKTIPKDESANPTSQSNNLEYTIFWKNKRMLKCLLILCFAVLTNSLMFYGLLMMSGNLTDNLYLGLFLTTVIDLPAAITICLVLDRFGRKKNCRAFLSLGATALCLSLIFSADFAASIPGSAIIKTILPVIGKYGVTVSYSIVFFYTPEVFPTTIRNQALGTTVVFARLGSMIAPFFRSFARHVSWGPGVVFVALSLGVVITIGFLPATENKEIPQTLEDFNKWFEKEEENEKRKQRKEKRLARIFL